MNHITVIYNHQFDTLSDVTSKWEIGVTANTECHTYLPIDDFKPDRPLFKGTLIFWVILHRYGDEQKWGKSAEFHHLTTAPK